MGKISNAHSHQRYIVEQVNRKWVMFTGQVKYLIQKKCFQIQQVSSLFIFIYVISTPVDKCGFSCIHFRDLYFCRGRQLERYILTNFDHYKYYKRYRLTKEANNKCNSFIITNQETLKNIFGLQEKYIPC